MRKTLLFAAVLILALVAPAAAQSVLQTVVDGMAPDSWAVLNTNGVDCSTLLECAEPGNSDNITSDATRGCWDPVLQQFHFLGQDHTNAAPPPRHVVYSASTNTWTARPLPPFGSGRVNHGWNYQACDSRGRALYRSYFGSLDVWRYNMDTQVWTNLGRPPAAVADYADGFAGYSFHPELGNKGWLVVAQLESGTQGVLYRYDEQTSSWARITPGLLSGFNGPYSWSEYSDVYQMTLFGNTTTLRRLWMKGPTQVIENAATPPCETGIDRMGIVHADPSTGNFVLLCGSGAASWHIYNPATNAWTTKASPASITNHILNFPTGGPNNPTWGVIGAPLWDHGVTMYIKCNLTSCGIRLYRGAAFGQADRNYKNRLAQAGVVNSFNMDTTRNVWYADTGIDSINCGSALGAAGLQHSQGLDGTRTNENNATTSGAQGCHWPSIDQNIKHTGLSSIRLTTPQNAGTTNTSGSFTEVFRRLHNAAGNPNGFFCVGVISPCATNGATVWIQYYVRMDSGILTQAGKSCSGSCAGTKLGMIYGEPPNGSDSSVIEITTVLYETGSTTFPVLTMYGQQGNDDSYYKNPQGGTVGPQPNVNCTFASQPTFGNCVKIIAGQWHELTFQITVASPATVGAGCTSNPKPNSLVNLWIDGTQVINNQCASISYGGADGNGVGQFVFTNYHTALQSGPNAQGNMWFDSMIVSKNPIAMGSGGQAPPPPPAAPTNLRIVP